MHVLYLHQYFVDRTGTSGGRSYEFSRLLLEREHEVTMITGAYEYSGKEPSKGLWATHSTVDGIQVRTIPVFYSQKMPYWRRIAAFSAFMTRASWIGCTVKNADVVYATSPPLTIAVPGIVASLYHRKPFVLEVRDLWPQAPIELGALPHPALRFAARALGKVAYLCADHIVALSPGMRDEIIKDGVESRRITVITNCSDVQLMRRSPEQAAQAMEQYPELQGRQVLLHAGAFGRINGLEYAVKLARELLDTAPEIAIVLMGHGSEKQRIIQFAKDAGVLDKNLFIYDSVPRTELGNLLSAATALLTLVAPYPVLQTNSANKFFDAFAAGKPVFINYDGWQRDLLDETGAGAVLPANDIKAAARLLTEKMRDQSWLQTASEASRKLGDTTFNRRERVIDFERVLLDATEDPTPRPLRLWQRTMRELRLGLQAARKYVI